MHNTWLQNEYWEDTKGKVNEEKERKNTLLTRWGKKPLQWIYMFKKKCQQNFLRIFFFLCFPYTFFFFFFAKLAAFHTNDETSDTVIFQLLHTIGLFFTLEGDLQYFNIILTHF